MANTNHSRCDQGRQSEKQPDSARKGGSDSNAGKEGMGKDGAMRDQTNDRGERPGEKPGSPSMSSSARKQ